MFCPNCGNNCPDNVNNCPNCGHAFAQQAPQQPQYQAPQQPYGQAPYGYQPFNNDPPIQESTGGLLAWSIITLLLCTIPGIVALVMTTGINKCATRSEQVKKMSNAKTWCLVGTILGGLYLLLTIIGTAASF